MMITGSLLSYQKGPLVPNKKEGIDSPQPRLGQTPDEDVASTTEYKSADWEDSPRICIPENALLP